MARILVVEDERNAREALGEVFASKHVVDLTADVDEAMAALEAHMPDLILTDVVLPGDRDGLQLLRTIKATYPDLPVIVMTAYGSVSRAVQAMRDGAHDFLEKPLELNRLRNLVASTLQNKVQAPETAPLREELSRGQVPAGFIGSVGTATSK